MSDRADRKEWLLSLWNYHNGDVSEEERKSLEEHFRSDLDARADSEKVLQVINQLRQVGDWKDEPDFVEEKLKHLMAVADPSLMVVVIGIGMAIVLLAIGAFFLWK